MYEKQTTHTKCNGSSVENFCLKVAHNVSVTSPDGKHTAQKE